MEKKAPWYVVTSRIIFLLLFTLLGYTFTISFVILILAEFQKTAEIYDMEKLKLLSKLIKLIIDHPTGTIVTTIIGYLAYTWYLLTGTVKMLTRRHPNGL